MPPKGLGGRPSKYEDRFCDLVIEAAHLKLSLTAFAGMIGVCRDTISEWMSVHPEFSAAVKVHAAVRTYAIETKMHSSGITGPEATIAIFTAKNCAPQEWRDKQDISHDVSMTLEDLVRASYKPGDAHSPNEAKKEEA